MLIGDNLGRTDIIILTRCRSRQTSQLHDKHDRPRDKRTDVNFVYEREVPRRIRPPFKIHESSRREIKNVTLCSV